MTDAVPSGVIRLNCSTSMPTLGEVDPSHAAAAGQPHETRVADRGRQRAVAHAGEQRDPVPLGEVGDALEPHAAGARA